MNERQAAVPQAIPDAVIEELLRAAVHDIRGPLNQLRALTGLLTAKHAEALGQDGRELCGFIEQAGARAVAVVDAIHAYAKVLGPAAVEPVDVNGAFESARQALAGEIDSRKAIVVASDLGCVRGDCGRIVQLLQELITNAMKFNASPNPGIRICGKPQLCQMLYSVADNGIGIPADRIETVFKPLKRLNGFEYEGAGMGLTVARRIVEAHGGRIWVEALPSGTDVRFTLPSCI